jgi:hypothetical protein
MPPTVVDEQPLEFVRWAPGLAAAHDYVAEEKRKAAQSSKQTEQDGPRFNGGW